MDDLSSLDWSAKPTGGQPKPPVMNSAFASMRPTPSPLASGRNTPLSTQGSGPLAPKTAPAPAKASQDSFSNLMNFGPAKAKQNLTLAERQAQLEAEKRQKEEERRKQQEAQFGNGQFWDALGSRGASTSPALQPPPASNTPKTDDDDLFAAFNKDTKVDNASYYPPPESHRSTPANAAPSAPPINLSDPNAWKTSGGGSSGGGFGVEDDDPFGLSELKPAAAPATSTQQADDDDFLGDLGRPVDEVRRKQEATRPSAEPGKPIEDEDSSSSDESAPPAREQFAERKPRVNKDPFDRAVAQLVDYGFSADDARRALVESGDGYNAQAAVNWLLDEAHRKSKEQAQGKTSSASSSRPGSRPPGNRPPRSDSRSPAAGDQDLAKTAAAVGNSLFKTANSLWKTGQKKMQQAVADFQQEGGDPNQPKWMREAQQQQSSRAQGKARADATDEAMMLEAGGRPQPRRTNSRPAEQREPQPPRGQSPAQSTGSRSSPAPRWQQQAPPSTSAFDSKSRLNRLAADDDSFSTYRSPNRRNKTPSQATSPAPTPKPAEPEPDLLFNSQEIKPSQSLPTRPAQPSPRPTPQAKRPPPPVSRPARPAREIPSISPVALQTSTQHRLQGTAHFKRGDYASAHASYSSSLSAVPPTHPLAILLLCNRSLTALKTGEPKQAVEDADTALKLIGPGNGQGEVVAVKNENGVDENRDLKELYGKALSRKAEALEQMEKWADASAVWQLCVESGVGGSNAIKGRQRCQNTLAPKPKPTPKPAAAKPRPRPTATASLGPQKSSEAVTRLREANEAAAKEDDEKFVLSEKVDARVSAWRDGKRDNLRALIASLDTVLWENSGWKKVGLHELVMTNKVKISYMKAIAKTHPDKLPQDASTE
ncbi:auxilin-like clathrin-binding protein required for normal clathrin function [Fusarium chlamydosporum]